MWELVKVKEGRLRLVESYLREGCEPFAVSTDAMGFITIWLKREVVRHEVLCKPEQPVKGTSRRTAAKTQG